MQLHEALDQISIIRSQIDRSQTYHGYRAGLVGLSGLMAWAAAGVQAMWIARPTEQAGQYLALWIAVSAVSLLLVGIEMGIRCYRTASSLRTQITILAMEQFAPCLLAGAMLTYAITSFAPDSLWLLPGLWPVVFSLGVFASCRFLPYPVVWVATWYLVSGIGCIVLARDTYALSPWAMAGTFGVGQLLSAAILYVKTEPRDGQDE